MSTRLHIELVLPDTVSPRLRKEVARESREQAVFALFKRHACSAGVAARLLKLSLHDFMDLLKERGIPYTDDSKEALVADRKTLRELRARSKRDSLPL